jgi:WD40 repeat protein
VTQDVRRAPISAGRRAALIGLASVVGVVVVGGLSAAVATHQLTQSKSLVTVKRTPTPLLTAQPTPSPRISAAPNALLVYRGHTGAVQSVGWSPDGTRVVSAGDDAQVHVWDARTGQLYFRLPGHQDSVQAVGWSPDGQYIASGSRDHTVRVWNAATGQLVSIYRGHTYGVNTLAWAPTNIGYQVASAGDAQETHIWYATSGQLYYIHSTPGKDVSAPPYNRVLSVTWGNAQLIAFAGDGSTTQAWGAPNSQSGDITFAAYTGSMLAIAWNPDFGRLMPFAGVNQDQALVLWDMSGISTPIWSYPLQRAAQAPGSNVSPLIYRHTNGRSIPLDTRSMFAPRAGLAWSSDGKSIVACAADVSSVSVVNGQSGTFLYAYQGHTAGVNAVACSPQKSPNCALLVASASQDQTVHIWSLPGAC